MAKIDNQRVFDTALAHLRKQGGLSVLGDGCAYHGPDGRMCAIGPLIRPAAYKTDLEGKAAETITPALTAFARRADPVLLAHIQARMHDSLRDGPRFLPSMEWAAQAIAAEWSLIYTPPEAG